MTLWGSGLARALGGLDRDRRGVPGAHPALVVGEILDPIAGRLAQFLVDEVVHPDPLALALGLSLVPPSGEVADFLLFPHLDADRRLAFRDELHDWSQMLGPLRSRHTSGHLGGRLRIRQALPHSIPTCLYRLRPNS